MSKYGVISGPYVSVFGLNKEISEPEVTPYLETFRNNIAVYLNNEIGNIDNETYDPHEENNSHRFKCYCDNVFNSYGGLNTHGRTCYVATISGINYFLLAER